MDSPRIRVLWVDDSRELTSAWNRLVGMQPDMAMAGLLYSADDLSATATATTPDVILLDASMPGRDPIDALKELKALRPESRVILFSGYNDSELLKEAADAGAVGFVDKNAEPNQVLTVIRAVARGETYWPKRR